MTEVPAFILDLSSTRGPKLPPLPGSAPALASDPATRAWTSWLRIRSDVTGFVAPTLDPESDELTGFVPPVFERDGLAVLATTRDPADLRGRAIGLFHARLDAEELAGLRARIEATPWADLPRPAGGQVTAPTLRLSYEREGLLIRRSFNACSGDFMAAIAPLLDQLDRVLARARKTAASSLALELAVEGEGLRLSLRSRGMGHAVINDPRLASPDPRLRVRVGAVASDTPHARVRDWVELPIPALPEAAPRTRVLAPHDRVDLELPWVAPRPGTYQIEASWRDDVGPVQPARGQTPFMPLPAQGPSSLGSGPYPIRGALFAARRVDAPSS